MKCPECGVEMDEVPQLVRVGNPYPAHRLWKCYRCGHEEIVDTNNPPLGAYPDDYPCPKCNTRLILHSHGNIAGECPKCGWFKPCDCVKCGGEVRYYPKTAHGSPAIFRCRACGNEEREKE